METDDAYRVQSISPIDVLKNKDFLSYSHVSFIIDYIFFFGGRLSIVTVSNVLKDLKSPNSTLALSL